MKMLIAVALVAAPLSLMSTAAAASGNDRASGERRLCTQVSGARAGSRMAPRRLCRTAAQWQEALGPDWRQRLTGRNLQDDMEALQARTSPVDSSSVGQQGIPITSPGHGSPGPN